MADTVDTGTAGAPGWWLDRLSRRLTERVRSQRIYEDYYHGDHRLSYATRKLLEAFGETFRYLRVNYCGVVVDALNERLEVQGFRFGDDQAAADAAWAIWQRNGMDARFAQGLREGLIKGESSIAVWVDEEGEPTLSVEDPFQVIVATDPATRVRRPPSSDGRTPIPTGRSPPCICPMPRTSTGPRPLAWSPPAGGSDGLSLMSPGRFRIRSMWCPSSPSPTSRTSRASVNRSWRPSCPSRTSSTRTPST
jgi:hypothetical protein